MTNRFVMSLKPFAVMTGSVALPTVQVCCESGSTFSVQFIAVNISLLVTTLEEGVGNVFCLGSHLCVT